MINEHILHDPVLLYNTIIHDIMANNPMLGDDFYNNPNLTFNFHPMYDMTDAVLPEIHTIDAETISSLEQHIPEIMVAEVLSFIDPYIGDVYFRIRCLNQQMNNYDKWVCMVGVDRCRPITFYDEKQYCSLSVSAYHLKQIEQLCEILPILYGKIESLNESTAFLTDAEYLHIESMSTSGYTPYDEPKFQFMVIPEPYRGLLYQIPRHVFILAMLLCGYEYLIETALHPPPIPHYYYSVPILHFRFYAKYLDYTFTECLQLFTRKPKHKPIV